MIQTCCDNEVSQKKLNKDTDSEGKHAEEELGLGRTFLRTNMLNMYHEYTQACKSLA